MIAIICNVFILIFKPFSIENRTGEIYLYLILFSLGLVFFLSVYVMEFLVPYLFEKPFKNWTLVKAIIWYGWMILFVGGVMFVYKSFLGGFSDFTFKEYLFVSGRVFSIGITVSFFVLGIFSYLNQRQISFLSSNETCLVTSPEAKPIRLILNEILFIESDDNYVDIHLLQEGERRTEIFRSSLRNMESQLIHATSPIYKCHRQYLINIKYFEISKKNSRSMAIALKDYGDILPVSRQYMEQIGQLLHTDP